MMNTLDKLKEKNIISEDQKILLEEYNERLKNNNVAIIYNLRHLRKILKIRKKDQSLFFGQEKEKSYKIFYISKNI